jgi:DNA modification methylase
MSDRPEVEDLKMRSITVALNKLYEARDERARVVFVQVVKVSDSQVRCQDFNNPDGDTFVLTPDRIVRQVTIGEIKKANAARLTQLEMDIESKTLTFVDIGNDLREIRDQRLYRVRSYPNFEDYCQVKWGMSRRYADFQIQAAEVFANIENNCSRLPLPTNEAQCREIARLQDPRLQVRAWEQAVQRLGGRIPTAEQVRAVIETDFRQTSHDRKVESAPATSPVEAKQKGFRVVGQPDRNEKGSDTRQRQTTDYPISPLKSTVVCGDCLVELDKLPEQSVDLVFTSPPYFNAHPDCGQYPSYEAYLDFMRSVIQKVSRVLVDGRFLVVNTSPVLEPRPSRGESSRRYAIPFDLHNVITELGYEFIEEVIWEKPEGAGWVSHRGRRFAADRYPLQYKTVPVTEYVMVYRKKSDRLIDWFIQNHPDRFLVEMSRIGGDYDVTNIWRINPSYSTVHPATFPVALAEKVIRYYSFKDDVVLDPFAGIGTVASAAMNLDRRFYVIEKNSKYVSHFLSAEKKRFSATRRSPVPAIRSSAR